MPVSYPVVTKTKPTFYFIGVTTTRSSIVHLFPRWMDALGCPEIVLEGVDLPIHADPQEYRQITAQIKADPKSLGGLVTTHKIDLVRAAKDLFDHLDSKARLLGEVSSISKQAGRLEGHAKDPISAGLSLEAILGEGYFGRSGGNMLIFGAGGSATALLLHLLTRGDPADRPKQVTLVDRLEDRLDHVRILADQFTGVMEVRTVHNTNTHQNDALLAGLPPCSVVVNATGMGKDIPGSPVSDGAVFPDQGVVWEFNYRGELDFLHQARRQAKSRGLVVEDGWLYFLHGWTQVIAQVLHIDLVPGLFERLKEIADEFRAG